MKTIQKIALLAASLSIFAFGCEKEQIGPSGQVPQDGTFKAYMTDSPGDYAGLDVEILRVEAYVEGSGWVTLNNQAQTISVLDLTNGAQTQIAATSSAKANFGTYSRLKLVFGDNNHLTLNAGATALLGSLSGSANGVVDLQMGGSHEVIVEIDEKVNARTGAEVLIDFDVAHSIYQEADHMVMQPTLSVISRVTTGVRGHVSGTAAAAVMLSNESDTVSTYINAQGDFLLRGMEDGVYQLTVMPAQVMGTLEAPEPKRIEGVIVSDGEISNAGTISFQ